MRAEKYRLNQITQQSVKTVSNWQRNGVYKLKVTHWFEMTSDFEETPVGQIEEGIEKAAWFHPNEIPEILKNSYENIKLLFEEENISFQ